MTTQILLAILFLTAIAQDDHDDHDHDHEDEHSEVMLSSAQIWGFGFLAILALSLIGFFAAGIILIVKKIGNETCFSYVIKFLFAFAAGALIGDVMVHVLAHAYASPDVQGAFVALIFICSLGLFIIVERAFTACGVSHTHWV